ncbi:MAG: helix-turn-helix domain-containing protein, partial [Nanoarchaeota archaeon]
MDTTILEDIGLTKSEIKVYFTLLELGPSTTGKIIEKSNVSSSKIYEILDKLIKKGLVNYILKGKIKYFEASDPNRIINFIDDKEKQLESQKKEIQEIIPKLELKKKLAKFKQEAKIYHGFKGLEVAFYDALNLMNKGESYIAYGIPKRSDKANRFFVKWNKERANKKIKQMILFNESARGDLQTLPKNNPLSEIKYLQEDMFMPAAINVFKDRTIIFPSETED